VLSTSVVISTASIGSSVNIAVSATPHATTLKAESWTLDARRLDARARLPHHYVYTAVTTASEGLVGSNNTTATRRPTTMSADAIARDVGMLLSHSVSEPVSCTSAR
jgi:hypothetical protein